MTRRDDMRLSLAEKVGYGLGDTASNFVWALMMNFIMYFYTDIFGITAAATGTMLLVARATDGLFDFSEFCSLIGFEDVWAFEKKWGKAG